MTMLPEKTVLFVGHDAYRAGAQIEMLHLVRWLRVHSPLHLVVLLKQGGDLLDDYSAIAPTYVLDEDPAVKGPVSRAVRRLGELGRRPPPSPVLRSLSRLSIDLIYVNSVASLDILPSLHALWPRPTICHVHELEVGIRSILGRDGFRNHEGHIDTFIAVSEAVRENLVSNHGVPAVRIHRVYEGIVPPDSAAVAAARLRVDVRRALDLPANAFVVGGSGTMDWRKAPDVFIHVARQLRSMRPELPAHFLWVGGDNSGSAIEALQYDVTRLGLESRIHFVGPKADPLPYFALFDVFLLTSREDPFPLVALEAAALGLPIVCFQGAGGMPEFVGSDAGVVVGYLDIAETASAIASLADSPDVRARLGQRAVAKVLTGHTIDVAGIQIRNVVETHCDRQASSSARPSRTNRVP